MTAQTDIDLDDRIAELMWGESIIPLDHEVPDHCRMSPHWNANGVLLRYSDWNPTTDANDDLRVFEWVRKNWRLLDRDKFSTALRGVLRENQGEDILVEDAHWMRYKVGSYTRAALEVHEGR